MFWQNDNCAPTLDMLLLLGCLYGTCQDNVPLKRILGGLEILMIQNKDIETKDTYINIGFSDTINKIINKEEIKQILKKYME